MYLSVVWCLLGGGEVPACWGSRWLLLDTEPKATVATMGRGRGGAAPWCRAVELPSLCGASDWLLRVCFFRP